MKRRLSHAALVTAMSIGVAVAEPGGPPRVTLSVRTPSVDVPPRLPDRRFLELPALEYSFDIGTRCGDDWVPQSLSVSVADSRVVVSASQLSGNEDRQISLTVPARQLSPVAVHDFCMIDEASAGSGSAPGELQESFSDPPVTVKAVLSAQASLLCRNESELSITYVSQPLDVTLACRPPTASGSTD